MLLEETWDRESKRERAALERAAFIVSGIFNARRTKKSDHVFKPSDFIKTPIVHLSAADAREAMRAWAASHNNRIKVARA